MSVGNNHNNFSRVCEFDINRKHKYFHIIYDCVYGISRNIIWVHQNLEITRLRQPATRACSIFY